MSTIKGTLDNLLGEGDKAVAMFFSISIPSGLSLWLGASLDQPKLYLWANLLQARRMLDLSRLKWTKNIKDPYGRWAYEPYLGAPVAMELPEARIFGLAWKSKDDWSNAEKPQKGDLILLHQKARVTHIVEVLDNKVYERNNPDWGIYRVVQAVWIPPLGKDWATIPHHNEMFGFDVFIMDGLAHNLDAPGEMPKFHERWDQEGGLIAFKEHLVTKLDERV